MGTSRRRAAKQKRKPAGVKPVNSPVPLAPAKPVIHEEEVNRLRQALAALDDQVQDLRRDFSKKELHDTRPQKFSAAMYATPLVAKILTDGLGVFIATLFFNMVAAWHSLPAWAQSKHVLGGLVFSWLIAEWLAYEAQRPK
ncbi:MAG TPA: hypothetical protein VGO96_15295 [Pyrinomonadaceae bacterium]|jgi:hypothetical protein|nr:hypothetical protein [Pyrinomonadaceae bacterium]